MTQVQPPVSVRRLRASDQRRWQELWQGYLHFYRHGLDDAVTARTFTRLCDAQEGMLGLVATDPDDDPVGLAHLVFHAATWSVAPFCYLEDLFVARDRRGGGVARALFAAVYATAAQHGCDRVYWHTQQFNAPARSLYDTVGQLTSMIVYEHDIKR
ncbi:MAG TPA: GNAT family N-acetyltransferase [Solirubrobacteraceae bacterium]|nr:GNAT family N-acetyltransferase [Solirubrobacteraceae bacterium]